MKKIFLFATALILTYSVGGQVIDTAHTTEAAQLLDKSRKQKTAAIVTGVTGVVLATIGGAIAMTEVGEGLVPGGSGYDEVNVHTAAVLTYAAAGLAVTSIYLFVSSGKNRREAGVTTLQLKMDSAPRPRSTGMAKCFYPSLGLRVGL